MKYETEILSGYRSEGVLLATIYTEYSKYGWKPKTGIEKYWSWAEFGFRFRVTMERPEKTPIIQHIDNRSETRTLGYSFFYTDQYDCKNEKHFYVDPTTFKHDEEFAAWIEEINFLRQKNKYLPGETPSISLTQGRYYFSGPE